MSQNTQHFHQWNLLSNHSLKKFQTQLQKKKWMLMLINYYLILVIILKNHIIIESYFQGQHLQRLVRHQLESYNHFINHQIEQTINMFNPVTIHSENDYIPEKDKYIIDIQINFKNFRILPPQIHENNGATKTMFPQEAKLRNFTYA